MIKKSIKNNFDEVWGRVSSETGVKSLRQLAVIIEKTQPTISAAKAKGEFPAGWAYQVGKKFGLLTEWIMTGEGPKKISEGIEINPLLIEVNEWLNEEKKHESIEFRRLFHSQMIRAFFDYEKWIKKRKMSLVDEPVTPSSKIA